MYDIYIYIIYIYICMSNLWIAAISLFESSPTQLRSNKDPYGSECSNQCQICQRYISLVVTLLDQQSAQPKQN